MRNLYTIVICLFITVLRAQGDGGNIELPNFNSGAEINGLIKLPKSPEADAFEKYGNTAVNIYTGTPDISVPLHTLKGRELDIPVVLNYDATGVKVSQMATNVGLSWNLTVGGRISRIANGKPDDLPGSAYDDPGEFLNYAETFSFSNYQNLEYYLEDFLEPAVNGLRDTELDLYSLNALNINDYIVIDLASGEAKTLLNPRILVDFNRALSRWEVTAEDGTKYYFGFDGDKEVTRIEGGDDAGGAITTYSGNSTTSWLLSKVESKNKFDTYEFDYKLYTWTDNTFGSTVTSKKWYWELHCPHAYFPDGFGYNGTKPYTVSQQMPLSIKRNGEYLVKFTYKSREDLSFINPYQGGNALNEILFYKYKAPITSANFENTNSSDVFKKVKFFHDYFGTVPSGQQAIYYKRLKLYKLTINESTAGNDKSYLFDYITPELVPKITSTGQDFWGMSNGYTNANLVPTATFGTSTFSGANRSYNHLKAIAGTLNRITYPTKGYTEFHYEQNELPDNVIIPEHPSTETVSILDFTCYKEFGFCLEETPAQYMGVNSAMQPFVQKYNFGMQVPNDTYSRFYPQNVMTTLMQIDTPTEQGAYFEFTTEGTGIFLIQQISGCENPTTVSYPDCVFLPEYAEEEITPSFFECLRPTNSLYMTGSSNYSHPTAYVRGGFTLMTNNQFNAITLPAGTYQVTCWSGYFFDFHENEGYSPIYQDVNIKVVKKYPVTIPAQTTYQTKLAEGFRIKEIKDFSPESAIPKHIKRYQYSSDFNPENSSGVRIFGDMPSGLVFYRTMSVTCVGNDYLGANAITNSIVINSISVSNTPYFAYGSVFEIDEDSEGNNVGFTQSRFHVGPTGVKYSDSGRPTSFLPVYQNGKVYEKNIFDSSQNLRQTELTEFGSHQFYSQSSFGFRRSHNTKFAYWNGGGGIQFAWGWADEDIELSWPLPAPPPPNFDSYQWKSKTLGKFSYDRVAQDFKGEFGYVKKKTVKSYPISGGELTQVSDYTYETESPFMLLSKQQQTSDGFIREEYTYDANNFPNNPEKVTDIVTSSNFGELSHRNNVFASYGDANMIQRISVSKNGETPELRLAIDYDSTTKNITNTLRDTGTGTQNDNFDCYVFGYNNMFPVAKIQGLHYGMINPTLLHSIEDITSQPITDTNTNTLLGYLETLRANHPQALVTSYTYDPVYGMTSQTDPKGNTTYYEYDELGRLKFVRDHHKNILSENTYNFKH